LARSQDTKIDVTVIVILTGKRGIGKSTVCRKTVALAQGEGHACGGILTLSHDDVRDALDVSSGDARRLTQELHAAQAVDQGRFRFDPRVLSWGSAALARATPCDLLVVDEIGPLELERGKGWVNAFDVLRDKDFALAVVVVRPELAAQAQLRLPNCDTMVLAVTRENRDQLPSTLMEMLGEAR
jgi:nucleoside-triphosphatase THEP1